MGLYQDFLSNGEKPTFKWLHYFPIYENHLNRFINRSVKILEIGVLDGGSLAMWRNFFGPHAEVIGIDLNPDCKKHESFQIRVEIGSQSDTDFLAEVFQKYGPFDVVIDDGSHKQADVLATLNFLIDKMPRNSVYIIEDSHTANIENYRNSERDLFEYLFPLVRELSAGYGVQNPSEFSPVLSSVSFYDSMIVIEFKDQSIRRAVQFESSSERRITRSLSPGEI